MPKESGYSMSVFEPFPVGFAKNNTPPWTTTKGRRKTEIGHAGEIISIRLLCFLFFVFRLFGELWHCMAGWISSSDPPWAFVTTVTPVFHILRSYVKIFWNSFQDFSKPYGFSYLYLGCRLKSRPPTTIRYGSVAAVIMRCVQVGVVDSEKECVLIRAPNANMCSSREASQVHFATNLCCSWLLTCAPTRVKPFWGSSRTLKFGHLYEWKASLAYRKKSK